MKIKVKQQVQARKENLAKNMVSEEQEIVKGGFWDKLPLFYHFCGAPMPSM